MRKVGELAGSLIMFVERIMRAGADLSDRLNRAVKRIDDELMRAREAGRRQGKRMAGLYGARLEAMIVRTGSIERYLASASPERNLELGYSVIRNNAGRVIKSVADVKPGENLESQLADGKIYSETRSIKKN